MKRLMFILMVSLSLLAFGAKEGLEAGDKFPEIKLYNTKGDLVGSSKDHLGKVTIYNFGASWCPPCKVEKPLLNKFYNANGDEVNVVSIMIDTDGKAVDKFYRDNPMDFPHYFDVGQKSANQFLIRVVPTTYIVDEKGINLIRIHGATDWSQMTMKDIEKLKE